MKWFQANIFVMEDTTEKDAVEFIDVNIATVQDGTAIVITSRTA